MFRMAIVVFILTLWAVAAGCGILNTSDAPEVLPGVARSSEELRAALTGTWAGPCQPLAADASAAAAQLQAEFQSEKVWVTFSGADEARIERRGFSEVECQGQDSLEVVLSGFFSVGEKAATEEGSWELEVFETARKERRILLTLVKVHGGALYLGTDFYNHPSWSSQTAPPQSQGLAAQRYRRSI